ncbi:MAG: 5'-methylthioadenosine/adenosylhomocysteine nucleosidase [Bacteroidaceae bacterium]|nr:5'-methylthioadenosine/adenosylhomocysteine nucleosidase [Bacteroidaceae bacterium]MBP5523131.1 5'-methylthioadenosine/adenosylhomocysteine nucleosidase [Bacteroidaceae bacterium]MBQ4380726.1 5'-methylthioadenosine/adenosylhomocysteine nucleosidase [Bacteroidaceae bacterium]
MKIGILTAMNVEYKQLVRLMENKAEIRSGIYTYTLGNIAGNDIILLQCGIGKVNAAIGTAELIKTFSPQCIISTGVAGGIDTSLSIMDVVVSRQICYHDVWCGMGCEYGQIQGMPTFFNGNPRLIEKALQLNDLQQTTKIHAGLICTGDQFISDQAELRKIKDHFPAGLACDMESAAIAQTCYLFQKPFVSFRIISDTPGADNHADQWTDFWEEMAQRSFAITLAYLNNLD